MTRPLLHIILHILVPGVVARLAFAKHWQRAWMIMLLTMVIDLDHLLATPLYDPHRCSIGFHPLHSAYAVGVYCLLTIFPASRMVGVGLVIHMILDSIDCVLME